MSSFRIVGGKELQGEVEVRGNKNSVLPLMAASLVTNSPVILSNVPRIRDVEFMEQLIEGLGAKVDGVGTDTLTIDASNLRSFEPDPELMGKFRASVVLIAPLLARFKKAVIAVPGGDSIGERLLDTHFELLTAFGVKIREKNGLFELNGKDIRPSSVFLDEASVTATEIGLIIGSSLLGKTVIDDAAADPNVQDLAQFLAKCGAKISGSGTYSISVEGKKQLSGASHRVREDHIETGTFAIAAAITRGHIFIKGAIEEDVKMILAYLSHMGVRFKFSANILEVLPSELVSSRKKFQTRPWPGFPTDLMSLFIVLATQTKGTVLCHDWMFEWRIFFVDHLIKMGANITIADPHRVIISGPTTLHSEVIPTPDIRAGSALVLAALAARGESIVEHAEIIDRGYEDLDGRLRALGAEIKRIE